MARRTGPKTSHKQKQKQKPKSKRESASRTAPTAAATSRGAAPFPKKDRPPSEAEFLARIPVAAGKKLESLRTVLGKQRGVAESLFFFGPKTGWAYRYLRGEQSVATLMLHAGQLTGIVALDGPALAKIDFAALSPAAAAARKAAHGSPSLSWLDLPVDGTGAGDFKVLVRAKLRTMPPPPTAEPSARPARAAADPGQTSGSTRRRLPPPPPPSAHSPPASADGAGPIEADVAPRPPGRTNRR